MCCVTLLCNAGFCRVPPCGMLRCVAVVLHGVSRRAALCWVMSWWWYMVASGCRWWCCLRCASWCVVLRAGTWLALRVASIFALLCCAVCYCVCVLGCVYRGVRFCVLRRGWFNVGFRCVVLCGEVARLVAFCCGSLPYGVLRCVVRGVRFCVLCRGLFGVGFSRVVFCGVVAHLEGFRCGTLPGGVLCCDVLLLLFPAGLVGLSFCGVVLWQLVWSFSLLSVVVWLTIGVLCWYVRCASLLRPVAPCFMSLCSIVGSCGSCIVSWLVFCRGVLCCRVVFRCVELYVSGRRPALSHGVVRCYLAICCIV